MAAATLKSIAEECGVSAQTVSRVLNPAFVHLYKKETCELIKKEYFWWILYALQFPCLFLLVLLSLFFLFFQNLRCLVLLMFAKSSRRVNMCSQLLLLKYYHTSFACSSLEKPTLTPVFFWKIHQNCLSFFIFNF